MTVSSAAGRALGVGIRPFAWVARARGLLWWLLVGVECLTAAVVGAALWWATGRLDVPDVSEPFDVEAFQNFRIDRNSNAYTIWRRALGRPEGPAALFDPNAKWRPDKADPRDTAWLKANGEALALFLEGAERPDALAPPYVPPEPGARPGVEVKTANVFGFRMLALQEVNRRAYRGDMDGAWTCLRASFRACRLIAQRGTVVERAMAGRMRTEALRRLGAWADDFRAANALLRRALDDLIALESIAPDDGVAIKAHYLFMKKRLNGTLNPWSDYNRGFPTGPDEWHLGRSVEATLYPFRRARVVEPDRSRRLLKLLTDEWLGYFAAPVEARGAPVAKVSYRTPWGTYGIDLFDYGSNARLVPPLTVARSFSRSFDGRLEMVSFWTEFKSVRRRERTDHGAALITLAEALYRRDHGGDGPMNSEVLVGPYLKALPDDGMNDPETEDSATVEIEGVQ